MKKKVELKTKEEIEDFENYKVKINDVFYTVQDIRKIFDGDKEKGFNYPIELFIQCMSLLTSQSSSARIESYIIKNLNYTRVEKIENRGDFKDNMEHYYELKVSIITKTNPTLNMVQIRLWQNVQGYLMIAIDTREKPFIIYPFELTEDQLINEMKLLKASHAHGTLEANRNNTNIEYRMSLKIDYKNEHFARWLTEYYRPEIKEKLFNYKNEI